MCFEFGVAARVVKQGEAEFCFRPFFNICALVLRGFDMLCVCQDFPVEPSNIMALWTNRKFSHEQAIADLYRCRFPAADKLIDFVQKIADHEQEELEAAQQRVVTAKLEETLLPFIKLSEVERWQQQYLPANFGRLRRFKVLVLRGDSQAGKTMFAESLWGTRFTLTVQCQGLVDDLPSLRHLDRAHHNCVVFHEVEPSQALSNKAFFQAGRSPVELSPSKCGGFRYRVWPYQLALVCCSETFPMTIREGLHSPEDEDWLRANCIVVSFFIGHTCFVPNNGAAASSA